MSLPAIPENKVIAPGGILASVLAENSPYSEELMAAAEDGFLKGWTVSQVQDHLFDGLKEAPSLPTLYRWKQHVDDWRFKNIQDRTDFLDYLNTAWLQSGYDLVGNMREAQSNMYRMLQSATGPDAPGLDPAVFNAYLKAHKALDEFITNLEKKMRPDLARPEHLRQFGAWLIGWMDGKYGGEAVIDLRAAIKEYLGAGVIDDEGS